MSERSLPIANPAFVEQFEKDLKFLQLFLLLVNKSCPIKRVDLVWAEDGPAGRVGLRQKHLSTEDALAGPCARLLACDNLPEPTYCYIMNDRGRHEAESCGISDKAAELRVRKTGRPEVYRCHAGLVDIAVPVQCEGQYIATLFTGQVLREPPTADQFVRIRKGTAALTYINWDDLEKAYMQVPVVSDADIQRTIQVLEVFAEYLATIWKRLSETVRDQQRRDRELSLERKEFAHLVLEGNVANRPVLRDLMTRIGFTRYPNRVMVVKFESENDYHNPATSFDLALARGLEAIEGICDGTPNVCCAHLRNRGVCVFFRDRGAAADGQASSMARAFAGKLMHAVSARCDLRARAGIGSAKNHWHYLADSYHEASIALAASSGDVAVYRSSFLPASEQLAESVGKICHCISERQLLEARMLVVGLPLLANREMVDRVDSQRHFLAYALESISYAVRQSGAATEDVARRQADGEQALDRAAAAFELQEAFVTAAESLLDSARRLYAGRPQKLVERACRIIARSLTDKWSAQEISLAKVAAGLGISAGHLSRVFKRTKGLTFERYLMMERVEAAKRMLLDPLDTISDVAEKSGFSDSAYFARVFRKIVGRSPSQYRNEPMRAPELPAGRAARV